MADQNYSAEIKMALQDAVTPVLDKIDKRLDELEKHFEKVEKQSEKAATGTGAAFKQMNTAVDDTLKAVGAFTAGVTAFVATIGAAAVAAAALGKTLYDAAAEQESFALALTSSFKAGGDFTKTMQMAESTLEDLEAISVKTGASVQGLVAGFRDLSIVGGGAASKSVSDLEQKLSILAKTSGGSLEGFTSAISRAALTGQMRMGSPEAKILSQYGLDGDALYALGQAGNLIDGLSSKLKISDDQIRAVSGSWGVMKQGLGELMHQAIEAVAKGLEPLRDDFKKLAEYLGSNEFKTKMFEWGQNLHMLIVTMKTDIDNFMASTKVLGAIWDVLNPFGKGSWGKVGTAMDDQQKVLMAGIKTIVDEQKKMDAEREKYLAGQGAGGGKTGGGPIAESDIAKAARIAVDKYKEEVEKGWRDIELITKGGLDRELAAIDNGYQDEIAKAKEQYDTLSKMKGLSAAQLLKIQDTYVSQVTLAQAKQDTMTQEAIRKHYNENYATMQKAAGDLAVLEAASYDKAKVAEEQRWQQEEESLRKALDDRQITQEEYNQRYDAAERIHNATRLQLAKDNIGDIQKLRILNDEEIKRLTNTGTTSAEGVKAAMLSIFNSLKTETEKAFDFVNALFGSLESNIYNALYSAFTGNQNFFKNFFKGIADDFSKSLANTFKNDLMPAVKGLFDSLFPQQMGPYPAGANGQEARPGMSPAATKWSIAGLAALGSVAQMSSANTLLGNGIAQAGISIGTALASTGVGVVVGAIVAAVGIIASALTPREADKESSYSGLDMATAARLGIAMGQEGSDRQVAGANAIKMSNSILNFFDAIFSKADPNFSRDILRGFKEKMLDYLSGITLGAHAGSEQDWKADIEKIFTSVIPKELMHAFFGQITYKVAEQAGITGGGKGLTFGDSTSRSSVDEKSPLVQFLTNLGFSIEKVQEIANQIDVMAPEEWQKWFSGIVSVVIDFGNNIKHLSMTTAQLFAELDKQAHPDVVAQFKESADSLVQMASDLSLFTGQDQIDKAAQLNQASDEYYKNALNALKALKDMVEAISNQADAFNESITMFLDAAKKNPAWLAADRKAWLSPGGVYSQQAAGTNDPAELQKIWNNFMADAAKQLKYLEDLYNQAAQNLETMKSLAHSFDTIFEDASRNFMDITQLWSDYNTIQHDIANTTKDNAEGQLKIVQNTQQLYSHLMAFIQGVNSAQSGLNTGIAGDIWSNNYAMAGNNDKSGTNGSQISMIKNKIMDDMSKISTATDPSEVTRLAGDIRGLLRTYQGFFKPGDPQYNNAFTWSNEILTQLQGVGTTALTGMGASARQIAAAMGTGGETMQTAQDLFQTALDAATLALGDLQDSVTAFQNQIDTKLLGLADGITTQMNRVAAALTKAMENFTKALGADPTTGGGGNGPGTPGGEVQNLGIQATACIGDENSGLKGVTAACNTLIATIKGA